MKKDCNMKSKASDRNYGFGRKMQFSANEALVAHYGTDRFGTRRAHTYRTSVIVQWLNDRGITDWRVVDVSHMYHFARDQAVAIDAGERKPRYATNLVSTFNVVMACLRQDDVLRVDSIVHVLGSVQRARQAPPNMSHEDMSYCVQALTASGYHEAALALRLARELGLRKKEAALLRIHQALKDARKDGRICLRKGTKGGRPRTVGVSKRALATLQSAAQFCQDRECLVPPDKKWVSFDSRRLGCKAVRRILKEHGIAGFHEMRAAWACERWEHITGHRAPILGGEKISVPAEKLMGLANELGHGRTDVFSSYIGSHSAPRARKPHLNVEPPKVVQRPKRGQGVTVAALLQGKLSGSHASRLRQLKHARLVEQTINDHFGQRPVTKWKLKHVVWLLNRHCKSLAPATRYAHWLAVRQILEVLDKMTWLEQLRKGPWARPNGEAGALHATGRPRRRIR